MSHNVLPFARVGRADPIAPARPAARPESAPREGFGQVFELEAARQARRNRAGGSHIPRDVLEEVQAAARLYDELRAEGRHVRFGLHDLDRSVVVDLCDLKGNVVRPISLHEAVTRPPEPPTAA